MRFPGKVNFSLIANRSATLRSALVALRPQLLACVACLPFLSVMADSQDAAVAGEVRSQASSSSTSDTANASELTLQDAVQKALTTYPTVRIALERALAARAQVGLVRTQPFRRQVSCGRPTEARTTIFQVCLYPRASFHLCLDRCLRIHRARRYGAAPEGS